MKLSRRNAFKKISLGLAGGPLLGQSLGGAATVPKFSEWFGTFSDDLVKDELYWKKFRDDFYDVSSDFINLENGYFGVQPKPVQQAYIKNIEKVNRFSSRYMRMSYPEEYRNIVRSLANFLAVSPEELLITRNATEAMNLLIQGLDLQKGDEVILSRQDYHSMIETFEMLEKQVGITLKFIRLPLVPKSDEEIIEHYLEAVTPNCKCVLLTHMIHLTGQILPVRKIANTLRPKGIEVIVDAAHSFAQVDFNVSDLGVDFVGVNLHKWFSNPLGAGLLYVKKGRVKDLEPLFGDSKKSVDNIYKLGHFGTLASPIIMTIPVAQEFNEMVTIPVKEKRLRYLQNYWTKEAAKIQKLVVTTPTETTRSCAIASFYIEGIQAKETVKFLYEKFKVFTVIRQLEDKQVVRITLNLYNHPGELEVLLEGMNALTKL